jgi:hypothetical protein
VISKAIAGLLLFACGAFAQGVEPQMVVNLDGFRYPPIAKQARVHGDVVFRVNQNGRTLVSSGNPLLTPAVADNLRTWTLPPRATGDYIVTFHFKILDVQHCLERRGPDPVPSYEIKRARDAKIDVVASAFAVCSIN